VVKNQSWTLQGAPGASCRSHGQADQRQHSCVAPWCTVFKDTRQLRDSRLPSRMAPLPKGPDVGQRRGRKFGGALQGRHPSPFASPSEGAMERRRGGKNERQKRLSVAVKAGHRLVG
jgi:hypothetical protein